MKKSLKVLSSIVVKNPCHESWSQMKGDDKNRFCLKCKHSVVNLSAMTRDEVEKLVARKSGERLCIRYFSNSDGSPRYKVPLDRFQRIWRDVTVLVVALLSLFGFTGQSRAEGNIGANPTAERAVMGEITAPIEHATPTPMPSPEPTVAQLPREIIGDMVAVETTPVQSETNNDGK